MSSTSTFTFKWGAFFAAFGIGLLAVYVIQPAVNYIDQYPNPHNMDRVVYRDIAGDCYKFNAKDVTCTSDAVAQPFAG